MFLNQLLKIYSENKEKDKLYLRSLLKEAIQAYLLKFISASKWNDKLIFKGGTALRFCFDLPRLSEDLDFDVEEFDKFDIEDFANSIKTYISQELKYHDLEVKVAKNKRTIYLKFPILRQLGVDVGSSESNIVHVRLDFAQAPDFKFNIEVSTKLTLGMALIMRRYSISDLFAGKIAAILTREKIEGVTLSERFKGRDYFDLIWYLERKVEPNWNIVKKQTGFDKKKAISKLKIKAARITKEQLIEDLSPFIDDPAFVESFAQNYQKLFGLQNLQSFN